MLWVVEAVKPLESVTVTLTETVPETETALSIVCVEDEPLFVVPLTVSA